MNTQQQAALDYAERNRLQLFATEAKGSTNFYNTTGIRAEWEAAFNQGLNLGLTACRSKLLLADVDVYGAEDREAAWNDFLTFCKGCKLTDEHGDPPRPFCHSRKGGWHFAFRCQRISTNIPMLAILNSSYRTFAS